MSESAQRHQMWTTILDLVIDSIGNQQLDGILDVIRNNLLYEDPGLLSAVIDDNCNEIIREKSLNIWLLNQVKHNETITDDQRAIEKLIDFQKDILSASLLRKQSIFKIILKNYIQYARDLINLSSFSENPTLEVFFTNDNKFILEFQPNAVYRKISVSNNLECEKLLEINIRILIHILPASLDLYEELFIDCTNCILDAFDKFQMPVKFLCLDYICEMLKTNFHFGQMFLIEVFILCQKVIEILPLNNEFEMFDNHDLDKLGLNMSNFFQILLDFYNSIKNKTNGSEKKAIFILLNILKSISGKEYEKFRHYLESLCGIILKVVIFLNNYSNIPYKYDELKEIIKLAENYPKLLQTLKWTITYELLEVESSPIMLNNSSKIWIYIHEYLLKTIQSSINENDETILSKNVVVLKEIFDLINNINFSCEVYQQNNRNKKKLNYNFVNKELIFIDNTITFGNLIADFITNIKSNNNLNPENYLHLIELINLIIQSSEFSKFNDELQNNIINLILQYINQVINFANSFPFKKICSNKILNQKSIEYLSNITVVHLKSATKRNLLESLENIIHRIFVRQDLQELQEIVANQWLNFYLNKLISVNILETEIIKPISSTLKKPEIFLKHLKNLVCLFHGDCFVIKNYINHLNIYKIICKQCDITFKCKNKDCENENYVQLIQDSQGILINWKLMSAPHILTNQEFISTFFDLLNENNAKLYPFALILNHCEFEHNENILNKWILLLPNIIELIIKKPTETYSPILINFIKDLLKLVDDCLEKNNKDEQIIVLNILRQFSFTVGIPEKIIFYLFKLMILFLIRYESHVSQEASRLVIEMCHKHGFVPKNIVHWYQRDIFKLIISLCAAMYFSHGLGLQKSLNCVSRMLGYKGPREFTYRNYEIIVTMLIQFCTEDRRCENLLNEVVLFTKMDLKTILKKSFLSFYLEYFIDKKCEASNECLDYIIEKTGCDIFSLMNSDIKKTVAKMLIYYHKNPEAIMNTFRCVLLRENDAKVPTNSSNILSSQSTDVIKFIADRFLGVITYFEIYLMNADFEKSLKVEILQSLGEIIRFLGPKYITPFHFKILAMLTTVITLDDDNLKEICVNVWKIFVHNVDVQILGASLSRIVAALEPLLIKNETEVNSIYKFLILTNGNLLSMHIPDLYFIENLKICSEIKQFVKQQIDKKWQTQNLLHKLIFFIKEIVHENVIIRVNGLLYLRKLFAENREELNRMIFEQNFIHPVLETIIKNLMIGCRHVDNNLKLASGKCIGELGAIEPGLMRPNYSQQKDYFPLDIHSDAFAILALKELCKAYQFQKDTLYVDNFSLGIQEILLARGVCPKKKTKMEVWEAIPERMRQIMEPLLTSCYTGMQKNENLKIHPVFGSSCSKTVIEWAFNWSSNMIERIEDEDTKHLLNSLLPSLRRDNNILDVFLPYIILHSLQSSSEIYAPRIYEELNFIFCSVLKSNNNSYQNLETDNEFVEFPYIELDSQPPHKSKLTRNNTMEILNDNIGIKCAKIGFEVLDFLEKWMREYLNTYADKSHSTFLAIKKFISNFNKIELALANYNCGEYARALKYCETFIDENTSTNSIQNNEKIQEHLSFLIKIYVELMDSDSLEGAIYMKKSQSSLKEQILVNSMTDKLQETAACYEQLIKELESTNELLTLDANDWDGIVQCYLRMDTPETALLISHGIMQKLGEKITNECMNESQAEPLWRLGRFEELGELLQKSDLSESNNWQIQCGRALLLFHRANEIPIDKFEMGIDIIRQDVLKVMKFGGTDCDSYHKGYSQVTRLHLLSDIEKARIIIDKIFLNIKSETTCVNILKCFFDDWNARLIFLQQTIRVIEPLLCIRRTLLTEAKRLIKSCTTQQNVVARLENIFDQEIGKLWIRSVQHNRKAGCYQQAHLSILNAETYKPNNLFIEKAKLYWKKGDQTNCFKVIEEKINEIEKIGNIEELSKDNRLIYANAKCLQASYNAESMNISSDLNIKYFQESLKYNAESEKCYVSMAQYYDRIYAAMDKDIQKTEIGERHLLYVMYNYGKSMFYGCEFMYQSMPRMLSIWFDVNASIGCETSRKVRKMNEFMEKCSQCLPLFLFFTAFSQLVSRICHPSDDVWKILKTIVIRLIEKYPQRSLWMILPVFKSSLSSRVRRCADIFSDKRLRQPNIQKLIKDFNSLADKLIELTNIEIPKSGQSITVSRLIGTLPKLLSDPDLSSIMIPMERYMKMTLPQLSERSKTPNQFNPFPNNIVYIKGIREEIIILNSLQKPKKVTLIGNDGKDYTIMLKPKDDLRKDFRLMEFNSVVKQYLYQDPQARQRRLGIRTYAVLPLNEECGIIEWVDNLKPFRTIILDIYKKRKQGMTNKELKIYMNKEENPIKRREMYLNELLPKHPPVFHEWFLQQFSNPHNWYQARTSYIRSTAVMSIVGYILGLGDRHGENILFDGSTGDIVHVDFNCLFNRGETFQFPEKVPFRLTHNMVHAMGPLGIEGPYKKCCEITMRVLQAQTPILMSVLKPFIYDPLVGWNKRYKNDQNIERTDGNAISNVKRIEARLKGYVNFEEKGANMPLSPEGVVNYVILQATDIDNLASMYVGWGPFM